MEIIRTSNNLSKPDLYKLTKDAHVMPLKNLPDGSVITPVKYAEYTETNSKGENVHIMSIMDESGSCVAFQSATARTAFNDILEIFEGELGFSLVKESGTSKAGRPYVTFSLA